MLWYVMVFSVAVNCHTEKLRRKVWKFPLPHILEIVLLLLNNIPIYSSQRHIGLVTAQT